jgi:hypothetical protein
MLVWFSCSDTHMKHSFLQRPNPSVKGTAELVPV